MANGVIDLALVNGDPFSEANLNSLEDYISRGGDYGAGAPSGTPSEGAWWYDTTNKRTYRYVNGAWITWHYNSTYTPTLANLAIGTGGSAANSASFTVHAGVITVEGSIVFGTSGTTLPGASQESITMPSGFTLANTSTNVDLVGGQVCYRDISAVSNFKGSLVALTSSTVGFFVPTVSGTVLINGALTATVPFAWAISDSIEYKFSARVSG